jgi:hypothetical protein
VFIISATINLPEKPRVSQGVRKAGVIAHPYNPRTSAKMRIRTIVTNTFDSYTYALTH